jgi:hypothetical protein
MVGADVEPADIVPHDDKYVRPPLLLLRSRRRANRHPNGDECGESEP